ncbi:MAG: dTMP kinase, partial [Terriglobales bacterium]
AIRRILLDSATTRLEPVPELLLYFASRAQNVREVIQPALAAGHIVLCDRYVDASAAYQGCGRGLGLDVVADLARIACDGVRPDLTLLLDVQPEDGLPRARTRIAAAASAAARAPDEGRFERENLAFFHRVRRAYLDIAAGDPGRVVVIAAAPPLDEVEAAVWRAVRERLGLAET